MPLTTFSATHTGAGRQSHFSAELLTAGLNELLQSGLSGLERSIAAHKRDVRRGRISGRQLSPGIVRAARVSDNGLPASPNRKH